MTGADRAGTVTASVSPRHVAVAVGASIGGLLVHNLQEFPPSILLAPETLAPAVITVLVGVGLLRRPSTGVFVAVAVWAIIVIVVGGGSVLPLPIWPFTPEQTVGHYAAHVVYAVAQLPLLWLAWRGFRATQPSN